MSTSRSSHRHLHEHSRANVNESVHDTKIKHRDRKSVAVLSDINIYREREKGNIVIEPYNPDNLSNCSYDVTLGENYYRHSEQKVHSKHVLNNNKEYLNPWKMEHVHKYWGKARKADIALPPDTTWNVDSGYLREPDNIDLGLKVGDKYILLSPGETILAHTNEFIGGRNFITTMMKARSSMGRCGVAVCKCAGWGDISYFNRWTMEITNSSDATIVLPVGSRVAQIIFLYSDYPEKIYKGKYQDSTDIEALISKWSPEMMLPKLYQEVKIEKEKKLDELLVQMTSNKDQIVKID